MKIEELFSLINVAQIYGIDGGYFVACRINENTSIEDYFGDTYYSVSNVSSFIEEGRYIAIYFDDIFEVNDFKRIFMEEENINLEEYSPNVIKNADADRCILLFSI